MHLNRSSLAAVALGALAAALGAQSRVQILHASDLEGGVEAIADAPNFAAVVEALENDAAGLSLPSFVLSSGDNYIPGPFFSSAGDFSLRGVIRSVTGNPDAREGEGRVDISIMNVIGFDAACIGNHEFDNGPTTFADLIGTDIRNLGTPSVQPRWLGAQFPYLSANLDFSGEASLASLFTNTLLPNTAFESPLANLAAAAAAPKIAPYTTITKGGVTLGVVGATTPLIETISSTGNVVVRNPGAGTNDMTLLASIVQPAVDTLTNAGVDKVILVTHLQQFALEQQLIQLLSGVDVVIAGGSDFLLADAGDRLRAGDTAQGPYPFVTTNLDGDPALIVSTDGQYSYVGRLVVDFDAMGKIVPGSVVQAQSGAFATDDQGVIDTFGSLAAAFAPGTKGADVQTLTSAVSSIVTARDGNIVGRASVFLDGRRTPVRTEETNMGAVTAEANLFVARSFDGTVLVSHKNGGGIRNPIGSIDGLTGELGPNRANPLSGKQAGEVSQLDIENSLRFNNGLTLVTLTRSQLKEVLEHAVAGSGGGATPGQFGQFAGLHFTFDVTRPVGSRVRDAALTVPAPQPILIRNGVVVGTDAIRIVTLNFLADGGDGYPFPAFIGVNPALANRVDLTSAGLPACLSTFAPAGSEQDAFAEYFLTFFDVDGYDEEDLPVERDQRIQQIGTRPALTISGSGAPGTTIDVSVTGATPNTAAAFLIGPFCARPVLPFPEGDVIFGVDASDILPLPMTDGAGSLVRSFNVPAVPALLEFVGQVIILDGVTSGGLQTSTTEFGGFTIG